MLSPTNAESLQLFLAGQPYVWCQSNRGKSSRLLRYDGVRDGNIHLLLNDNRTIKFPLVPGEGGEIAFKTGSFTWAIGDLYCEYSYVPNEKVTAFEWDEMFNDIEEHHGSK